MKPISTVIFSGSLLFFLSLTWSVQAQVAEEQSSSWPGFLGGAARDSVSSLPLEWSAESNLPWTVDLTGYGQSSPVVAEGKIYLTSVDGPMKERNLVHCLDLESGELLWTHQSDSSIQVENNVYTSRAAPTAVADTNGVIAFFESGDIFALGPDKSLRWERHLVDDYGKIEGRFGLGSSLAQLPDRVFVLADNEGPSYLLALRKDNGETIWKAERESRVAWSSPMVLHVEGEPQVVVSSAGSVEGYDPETGEVLWSIDDVGGNTVASPVPADSDSGRFLVGASAGRNGENTEGARRSNMAVQITREADGSFKANVLWRNEEATSSFGSPVVYQERAYYVNRSGGMYCIDLASGETLYKHRIQESGWATPIGVGDRVYFFGKSGATTVIKASEEYEELAVNQLYESAPGGGGPGNFGGEIQYGYAVADGKLLVRTGKKLYCVSTSSNN